MEFQYKAGRIFLMDENEKLIAEVTYYDIDEHTVNVNHTFVDPSLRGQGVADKLMSALSEKMRSENKKIVPTCSYAVKWLSKL